MYEAQMTDRPILFSAPMVRALREGRKTQTRRILKPQLECSSHAAWPDNPEPVPSLDEDGVHCATCGAGIGPRKGGWKGIPVRFAVGDRLWVRETFSGAHELRHLPPRDWVSPFWYWADGNPDDGDWTKPKPGIHMPRWASRLTLVVSNVKVERLHDISLLDAMAEGCEIRQMWLFGLEGEERRQVGVRSFQSVWENVNGADSWKSNPFVVAVSFHVYRKNIDAMEARAA
jgi:hypothetical protein